jgi:thiol-disulfide isomerase/thioredoxin
VLHQAALRRAQLLAVAAALALPSCRHSSGEPSPTLRPIDGAGLTRELAAQRGHPLVLNFWASWCVPCLDEFPELVRSARALRPRGVRFVSVSADDLQEKEKVRALLDRFGAPFDAILIAAGGEGAASIIDGVDKDWSGALPATFVYDARGQLVQKRVGEVDAATVEKWTRPLLSGGGDAKSAAEQPHP